MPYYTDAILAGELYRWNYGQSVGTEVTVSFSFPDSIPSYYAANAPEQNNFSAFSDQQVQATYEILSGVSEFANITFVENTTGDGQITFANANLGSGIGAWAYYAGTFDPLLGDVWINNLYAGQLQPDPGDYAYLTEIHELGHALGLQHPGDYDAGAGGSGELYLPPEEENRQYTVMSYDKHPDMGGAEAQTFQLYDIAALQHLYGANMDHATGDDVYNYAGSNKLIETIWDAGGYDTLDATGDTAGVTLDLHEGGFSSIGTSGSNAAVNNIAIAFGAEIEAAVGGDGNDTLIGNDLDNFLSGGLGNDDLFGNGGSDILLGGGGNDNLTGGADGDVFLFEFDWGADVVLDFEFDLDTIDLFGTGLGYADLTITYDAAGALVNSAMGSILFADLAASTLDSGDFLFSVPTAPSLTVQAAAGDEDTAIALNIDAALVDTGSPESLSIAIEGVPDGATLSAGTDNGGGSWTLAAGDLANLTITPAADSDDDFALTVTATATRTDNGTTAVSTGTVTVDVAALADTPSLTVQGASGDEGTPIALDIGAALSDTDGSESLSITIAEVPTGAVLSAGTDNGNGSFTLTSAQLVGLTITPGNSDDFTLTVTATATEADGGNTAVQTGAILVDVIATVPDAPDAPPGETLTGTNGADVLTGGAGNDVIDGERGSDVLSGGGGDDFIDGSSGFDLIDGGAGTDVIKGGGGEDVLNGGLGDDTLYGQKHADTFVFDADWGNDVIADFTDGEDLMDFSSTSFAFGDLSITYDSSGAQVGDGVNSIQLNGVANGTLSGADFVFSAATDGGGEPSGDQSADTPSLTLQDASGAEDAAIALNITAALADTDGSESLSITIAGVPAGAALSAGTDNGGGIYTLTPDQLTGLTVTPPANSDADFSLTVTATSTEANGGATAMSTGTVAVDVAALADTPSLTVQGASGDEGTPIALDIGAALSDTDGSESLSITIADVPTGAALSAGTDNGNGSFTLTSAQLAGLTITPGNSDDFTLTVTATATEADGGDTAAQTGAILVDVIPTVPDAPDPQPGETLTGTNGKDVLTGGAGNDFIDGDRGSDVLNGGGGDDFIDGNSGFDVMDGGAGNDILKGGGGEDVLNGGLGDDILYGQKHADTFVFDADWGNDVIADFTAGEDLMDFSSTGLAFGDLSIAYDASGATVSDGFSSVQVADAADGSLSEGDFIFS